MATQKNSVHAVGNLNSKHVVTIPEVKAGADIENYTLVELNYVDGERIASPLTDATKEGFLACAVEVLYDGEAMREFYVGKDEFFRVVHLEKGVRFETSAFSGTPALGKYATYEPASDKFVFSDTVNSTVKKNFQVVDILANEYGFGLPMVRLETL